MRLACGLVLKICNFDKNKKPSVRNTESELLVLLETKGYAIKTCTSYCYKSTLNLGEMNFSETLLLNDKLSVWSHRSYKYSKKWKNKYFRWSLACFASSAGLGVNSWGDELYVNSTILLITLKE